MATYGSIPGVQISTSTGNVSGVTIGRSQYLLLAGVGNSNADVDPADPVEIDGQEDVDEKFGEGSDVAEAYRNALDNGADPDFVRAVRVPTTTVSGDTFTDVSGTIVDTPILSDTGEIEAEYDGGDTLDVKLDWSSPPEPPEEGEVNVNPYTGEFEAEESDVSFEYQHLEWGDALYSLTGELTEGEFGVISPLTASSDVGAMLDMMIEDMRDNMKMVVGMMGAEYNGTTDSGRPALDASEFENTLNSDTMFTVGPTALAGPDVYAFDDSDRTEAGMGLEALGAAAGLFAGNSNTDPVYDSVLSGVTDLEQGVSRADVADLRDEYVIPIRDIGAIRLEDNHSTYDQEEEGGWERDYFRRRIVDLVTVTLFLTARQQIGGILDGDTVSDVQDAVAVQLSDLVEDGLLEAGEQEVNVFRQDDRTIGMDVVITPLGVAKGADINLEINA